MQNLQIMTQEMVVLCSAPASTVPIPNSSLEVQRLHPKMTVNDDIKASTFERTTVHKDWPPCDWAHLVAPLLTGAQQVHHSLSAATAEDYNMLQGWNLSQMWPLCEPHFCCLPSVELQVGARATHPGCWSFLDRMLFFAARPANRPHAMATTVQDVSMPTESEQP